MKVLSSLQMKSDEKKKRCVGLEAGIFVETSYPLSASHHGHQQKKPPKRDVLISGRGTYYGSRLGAQ